MGRTSRYKECCAHLNAYCTQHERRHESLAISDAARCDNGNIHRFGNLAHHGEGAHLADVSAALHTFGYNSGRAQILHLLRCASVGNEADDLDAALHEDRNDLLGVACR